MKIKLSQTIAIFDLMQKLGTMELSFKLAYQISLIKKEIEDKTEFYREHLRLLIQEYGLKDEKGNFVQTEDGNGIKLIPEKQNDFVKKMNELDDIDVELSVKPIPLSELENLKLTPNEVQVLIPFVEE